ncbi:UDP-glucose:glycoprotein glucosyltransferase [Strigomonas culicis]|uniref:UDP-glucose:glycoprotein glucosyltransferase n=1 Tax=Strigomonas culicis TaxID=28005 RepID=S9TRF2_9TRYP|nr:UDP-glucose:glycoprotein glucosyltransferase [Strigomonas culicis]|eukprot:EPY20967.1 UDP-glucose:glycoprotein glucosyltransferase [Strigomonas culicis]
MAFEPMFMQANVLPRRNLMTSVYVVDPMDEESMYETVRAYQAIESGLFLRIGVVFFDPTWTETVDGDNVHGSPKDTEKLSVARLLSALLYAMDNKKDTSHKLYVIQTLYQDMKQSEQAKEPESVFQFVLGAMEKYTRTTLEQVLSSADFATWYHAQQQALRERRLAAQLPAVYLNGLHAREVEVKSLYKVYVDEVSTIRKLIQTAVLQDKDKNLYDTILKHFNARAKKRIHFTRPRNHLPLDTVDMFHFVSSRPYVYAEAYDGVVSPVTLALVVPCEAPLAHALTSLEIALSYTKAAAELRVRLTVAVCPARPATLASQIERVWRAAETLPEERRVGFLLDFVAHAKRAVEQLALDPLTNVSSVPALQLDDPSLTETLLRYEQHATAEASRRLDYLQQKFFENVRLRGPWYDPQLPWLFANGVTQALEADFTTADVRDIVEDCGALTKTVMRQIEEVPFAGPGTSFAPEALDSAFYATKIALVASITTPLAKRVSGRRAVTPIHEFIRATYGKTAFKMKPEGPVRHHMCVVLDPVLRESQLVMALSDHFLRSPLGVHLTVLMNPSTNVRIPIRNLYTFAADWDVHFDATGRVVPPSSIFRGLPTQALLTLGVEGPYAWTVFPSETDHDLDNILLSRLPADETLLRATYRIQSLVFVGSAYLNERPAQGLPLQVTPLLTREKPIDTLVMMNRGYYQLLVKPGVWHLSISPGPVASAFYIDTIDEQKLSAVRNGELLPSKERAQQIPVLMDSFEGKQLDLDIVAMDPERSVSLKELIQVSYTAKRDAWPPAKGTQATERPARPTLNIFSVASGHLYERFLRMMMRSVFRASSDLHGANTTRIKFWVIENFLSPQFKLYIPGIAAKYGFEVQFVTYQWPYWLHPQTEKQRRIWAYKILFLDVLFPLDVDRIIFVDADQTAHADLHDLYNMDIGDAAIAMTPFCEAHKNQATAQFRFWESNYWKKQLNGRPYHISAIFLVDLQKFRSSGSADIYRFIYQEYTTDPSSLANLDQDLPNVIQHLVPMYSLPEEWLWCETWCDQESKKKAKTIDLCNNPLTKIPKLQNAKTIVPQWEDWDRELEALAEEVLANLEAKS